MSANDKLEATFHPADPAQLEPITEPWQNEPGKLVEVERETIGDWAGHIGTPLELTPAVRDAIIHNGMQELIEAAGTNSRDHGFHDDWPKDPIDGDDSYRRPESYQRQLGLAIVEKLALIHEEISESLGEIRSGRHPLEIYFVDTKGLIGEKGDEHGNQAYGKIVDGKVVSYVFGNTVGDRVTPLLKPEGFLVELVDAIIRVSDLVFLVDGAEDFIEALLAKMEFNATRPYKHGRRF